jgi:magnesium transporter
MATTTGNPLADRLRAALRVPPGDGGDLAMIAALRNQHPADIADALLALEKRESLAVFNWLDNARAAQVLEEVDPATSHYFIDNAPPGRIADLLDRLPMDDAAEVVADLSEESPEKAEEVLADLARRAPEDAEEIRDLLSYEENTAGRLMTDNFVRLSPGMTVEEAFEAVRYADPEVETLTELYVVEPFDQARTLPTVKTRPQPDEDERLVGVIPLRLLVRARGSQRIRDIMIAEPLTVPVDTDQEEVARIFSKYSFLALPVLDRRGALAGIVTMDDIVHVLVEEQTEDVLALGAVSALDDEKPYLAQSVMSTVRQRIGWLLLLFVASLATGAVSRHYEGTIQRMAVLATFVPLLIGTGGNAGAQAVMTVTRALALGEVGFDDALQVLWREVRTGLLLGVCLSVIGYGFVFIGWREGAQLSLVIACSMTAIVIWASTVGSILPLVAKRLGFDPALMSAPFITTLVDATGLYFYFSIARLLLPQLRGS